jgi:hypothetical protein
VELETDIICRDKTKNIIIIFIVIIVITTIVIIEDNSGHC